jgi:putative spermidine/putrescine transport system ATP-binding protein
MAMVELKAVSKRYGDVVALATIDLSIGKGEFVTLLGPSGSGKTTLLNLIAGMTPPSSGRVFIDGRDVTLAPPGQRGLGMVFQNYALMPHMTIFENIAFPLRVRRVSEEQIRARVAEVLELVKLPQIANRYPRELSGGQQQRVSLARCVIYKPALILMDEPLGALDKKLREQIQLEIKHIHARLGITILYVTHDQEEALTMSDRIVLMRDGQIEQQGPPDELYFRPRTVFAADFIGSSNLLAGCVESVGDTVTIRLGCGLATAMAARFPLRAGAVTSCLVRPECMVMAHAKPDRDNAFEGVFEDSIVLGGVVKHFISLPDGSKVTVQEPNRPGGGKLAAGQAVWIGWNTEECLLLPPQQGATSGPSAP